MSADRDFGLVVLAADDFKLPIATPTGQPAIFKDCSGYPLIIWPNYSSCFEANCWIDTLRASGLSAASACQYGYKISWILRYCDEHGLQLHHFNDYHFFNLMTKVKAAHKQRQGTELFTENTAFIGRKTLDFLEFVGQIYGIQDFIHPMGRINATKKEVSRKVHGSTRTYLVWHHNSIPRVISPQPSKSKILVEQEINALKYAIRSSKSRSIVRHRQSAITEVLQGTGGRRAEITPLTVGAVWDAELRPQPALLLSTLKKSAKAFRLVEIDESLLALLQDYIEFDLKPFLLGINKIVTRDTPLFISLKTLDPIQPNTLTHELSQHGATADIDRSIHPHLFRHLSITNDRVKHFEKHPLDNQIARLIGMAGVPDYTLRSMERHGHSSPESQATYNHYDQLKNTQNTALRSNDQARSSLISNLEKIKELLQDGRLDRLKVERLEKLAVENLKIMQRDILL